MKTILCHYTQEQQDAALRLYHLVKQHPGTSGGNGAAKLLLGLYNGRRFPFDLTELRIFDPQNLDAALTVLRMDASRTWCEIHDLLNAILDTTHVGAEFEIWAYDMRLKGRCTKANYGPAGYRTVQSVRLWCAGAMYTPWIADLVATALLKRFMGNFSETAGRSSYQPERHLMSNFNPRETMFAAADAISLRLGGHPPCPHPLADGLTLRAIAKAAGVMIRPDMDIDDPRAESLGIVQGEFATKLATGVEKAARDAFALQRQHAGFLTEVGVRDFKPAQQESMAGNAALELTAPNSEIQIGRCELSESVGTAALQSYAKILTLSRKDMINDTLGGFSRATWQVGASAAQIEAGLVAAQLEANPVLPDGGVTFDASFGNVTAELLGGGLAVGMELLRQQNSGHGVMTNAAAKFLVCSPGLEWTADKVVDLVAALVAWSNANDNLKSSQEQSIAINTRAGDSLARFAETTGLVVKSIDEADALISSGTVVWSTAANGWVKAGDALADVAGAAADTVNPFEKSNAAMLAAASAGDKVGKSSRELAAGQKDVVTYTMQTVPVFDALTGKITGYEQRLVAAAGGAVALGGAAKGLNQDLSTSAGVMDALAQKTDLTNKELIDLAKVTKDAEGKLAELASNERIKFIEANVSLNIANLEANTKVATALIEGISSTIDASSKLLGDLFGQFGNFDKMGFSEQWKIIDQINIENKLKQEAFDLQKKLTEAQIEMMKAQTDMLVNGDGLIKITGDGLEPHLEAFMWKIIEKVQVRVNKDGLKMLLGV